MPLDKVQAMDSLLQLLDSLFDFLHILSLTHDADPVIDWHTVWKKKGLDLFLVQSGKKKKKQINAGVKKEKETSTNWQSER